MAAEQAMTPEALDQWRWELAREVAYEGEIPEDAAWWIAASEHYRHLVREDVRPDKGVATTDTLTPQGADGRQALKLDEVFYDITSVIETSPEFCAASVKFAILSFLPALLAHPEVVPKPETAEPVAQVQRRLFPVLGTKGAAKVDWQFVNDHAGQAYDNHYQTIERLAERGGLSWDELAAIIEGRKWHKMNITEAVETVRRAEAKYLSALYTHPAQSEAVEALETAIRNHADTHGPSGPQWNISSILDVIRAALKGSRP